MISGYCVIWKGQTSTMFYDGEGWTFDACEAKVYGTWLLAWTRAVMGKGVSVAKAWVDE
jgi:hypothetical protein